MPNRLITITTSAAVALPVLLMAGTQSSNQLPPPEDTEIWEPEPKVVGSGTQSAIPTDAENYDELVSMIVKKHDGSIEEETAIADQWNEAVRAYNSQ